MTAQLEGLARRLAGAKDAERTATAERIRVEGEIIALTGLPEEGSKTFDVGRFKLTVAQRINRSLDERAWALVADKIPAALSPVHWKQVPTIEAVGVRWLRDNEPGYFRLLASALTEKPAKPSVTLEEVSR
jgi:hypothetical protein